MEPGSERIAHPETACLLDQDQERGLKRIIGFIITGQHAPADAEDHGAVALDQQGERELGGFAAVGCESLQELAVGQITCDADVEKGSNFLHESRILVEVHRRGSPPEGAVAWIQVMYRRPAWVPRFFRIRGLTYFRASTRALNSGSERSWAKSGSVRMGAGSR